MAGHTERNMKMKEDKKLPRRIWLKTGWNVNYMMLDKLHYSLLKTKIQNIQCFCSLHFIWNLGRRDKTIIIKVILILISCEAKGKIGNLVDICSEAACGMQISMNQVGENVCAKHCLSEYRFHNQHQKTLKTEKGIFIFYKMPLFSEMKQKLSSTSAFQKLVHC